MRLPEGVEFYRRTASFTETSIPAGLLKDHHTKHDAWGLIRVEHGRLLYVVTDPRRPASQSIVTSTMPAVIEPAILHRVEPIGPVLFHVEFHREITGSSEPTESPI
jgi:tellurite resistance-related uncharacterized protein